MSVPAVLPLDWWLALPIRSLDLHPVAQGEQDLTGGGEVLFSSLAPALWQGTVTLGTLLPHEADHAQTMLDLWSAPGRLALICDIARPAPAADPSGVLLGAATPIVAAVSFGSNTVSLTGLPAGYQLRLGDLIGWSYDGGRRALHRIASLTVTADVSGATGPIALSTPVRAGLVPGAAVTLVRPTMAAALDRSAIERGGRLRTITTGTQFRVVQTLARLP